MRPSQWEHWPTQGGSRSFRATFPEEYRALMEGITIGVPVDYDGDRTKPRFGHNQPQDDAGAAKISAVIAEDIAAGKKAGPFDDLPFPNLNVSPIGAVPKKNGKIRVIHNLSYPFKGDSVNNGIKEATYVNARFGHAARAVVRFGKGCYLIKLDVEAAFKQVPVRPQDWHLLGFMWLGKYYYERVLPFGIRSSCRLWELYAAALHHLFEKVMNVVGDPERAMRIVIHYVDDFLFVVSTLEQARAVRPAAEELCRMLGLPMAEDKTEGPVQCLTFLGIELDTVAMEARLPATKLAELKQLCSDWLDKSTATLKEVQSLHGSLRFACAVVMPGRHQLGRIMGHLRWLLSKAPGHHVRYQIPDPVREDVRWWHQFLQTFNGKSVLYELEWQSAELIELHTDACEFGYGAVYGDRWFAGAWSHAQRAASIAKTKRSMPFFELYALVAAAKAWGASWTGKKITFRCDCDPVVKAVTKGSSSKPQMMNLIRQLGETACEHRFDFRCIHIPGVTNVVADCLSRFGDCPQFRALRPSALAKPDSVPALPLLPVLAQPQ